MTTRKVDVIRRIPFDEAALRSGDPIKQAKAIKDIVKVLQIILEDITSVTNLNVDLFDGEALYSKAKLADGTYPIGSWRLIQVGDNWERQVQLTLNVWTKAGTFNRPKT